MPIGIVARQRHFDDHDLDWAASWVREASRARRSDSEGVVAPILRKREAGGTRS